MREFKVIVNGQAYQVSVEEISSAETNTFSAPKQSAEVKAPALAPAQPVNPAPTPATAEPTPKSQGPCTEVVAPMPGVILNIMVAVGQAVNEGDVLLILEAMKMENEVSAPSAGTVKEIAVCKGSNVNTGDIMVVIE